MKLLPIFLPLLVLPLLAIGIILLARRSKSIPYLSLAFILSGIAGAVIAALITFSLSTVPIAPYESSQTAWYPLFWNMLLSLYIGFGLGVAIATIAVFPFWLKKRWW